MNPADVADLETAIQELQAIFGQIAPAVLRLEQNYDELQSIDQLATAMRPIRLLSALLSSNEVATRMQNVSAIWTTLHRW